VVPPLEDIIGEYLVGKISETDDEIRKQANKLLKYGLQTEVFPRAYEQDQILDVIKRLRESDGSLEQRLIIGGFTLYPIEDEDIEQACETCMYYLVHRRYCELPELDVPVEAEWSCRLWRI